MSSCWKRDFRRALRPMKNCRFSSASSASTNMRLSRSRYSMPPWRQMPSIACGSHETPPKRRWISTAASARHARGTGRPSLNSNGKRISKRQYALMRGRSLDRERDSFPRHRRESLFRDGDFAARPGVARKPPDKEAKRPLLSRFVGKADNDHAVKLAERSETRKPGNAVQTKRIKVNSEDHRTSGRVYPGATLSAVSFFSNSAGFMEIGGRTQAIMTIKTIFPSHGGAVRFAPRCDY